MLLSFNHRLDDSFRMQNSKPINSTDERTDEKKQSTGIFQMNRFLFHVYTECKSNKAKMRKKISRPFVYVSDCNRTLMHPMIN